jgi:carboxyl-terminal processing protease
LRTTKLGLAGSLARISGPLGTSIGLNLRRDGKTLHLVARRARVTAPNVTSRAVSFGGRTYGYIRIASFRTTTAAEVALRLRRLRAAHPAGFVLDLRANPGGLFEEAIDVTSLFLRHGTVVWIEGAHRPREIYSASGDPVSPDAPLVVLVDRYSASSAEVVAAALHDNKRGMLIGEHTFGKAVVQSLDPLGNGAALALTTARYFTPAGLDISRKGVRPDIRVADDRRTQVDDVLVAGLTALAAAKS